jgi:hypothetical protein
MDQLRNSPIHQSAGFNYWRQDPNLGFKKFEEMGYAIIIYPSIISASF